jgi:hypothetical protein
MNWESSTYSASHNYRFTWIKKLVPAYLEPEKRKHQGRLERRGQGWGRQWLRGLITVGTAQCEALLGAQGEGLDIVAAAHARAGLVRGWDAIAQGSRGSRRLRRRTTTTRHRPVVGGRGWHWRWWRLLESFGKGDDDTVKCPCLVLVIEW